MNLLVRPVETSDARSIHRYQTHQHVMPYIRSLPSERIDQVEEQYRNLGFWRIIPEHKPYPMQEVN